MTSSNADIILHWLPSLERNQLSEVIQTLLLLEKEFKASQPHSFELLGMWQLTVIGGKQSLGDTSQRQGKLLPKWLKIYQIYEETSVDRNQANPRQGTIMNQVHMGPIKLELSGPWKFYDKAQILAFDFLLLQLSFLGKSLVSLPMRGGQAAEARFWDQPVKDLAFFRFFWMTPQAIAARGRGGGVALWKKVERPLG